MHTLGIIFISLASCKESRMSTTDSPDDMSREEAVDSSLPGPQRAAAAAKRTSPILEPELKKKGLAMGNPVYLRAFKEEEKLELWMRNERTDQFKLFRTYKIAAMSGNLGPKMAEGDKQVPEGFYHFNTRNLKPDSRFHLAFNIGYPNTYDKHHGRTGSFIMVHGNKVSAGCLAMTDPKIEEIYTLCAAALERGQPFIRIHIFPFHMTGENMQKHSNNRHIDFWRNLKDGYDLFESTHLPPDTTIRSGRYAFRRNED